MVTRVVTEDEVRRLQEWVGRLIADRGERGQGQWQWSWSAPSAWSAPAAVAVALGLEAGLRVGELKCLSIGSMAAAGGRPRWIEIFSRKAKRRHGRRVPVSPFLADILEAGWLTWLATASCRTGPDRADSGSAWLCVSTRTIERVVARVGRSLLGRAIIPHALRHTYATRLLRVSDIKTVQECLGHARMGTTERYLHVTTDDLAKAAGRLPVAVRH